MVNNGKRGEEIMASFFDRFKKVYICAVRCYNCGHIMDCKIPKGLTIDSHLKSEGAMCENCGNPTLRRIERVRAPEGVQVPLKEYENFVERTRRNDLPILPDLPPRRNPDPRIQRQRQNSPPRPIYRQQRPLQRRSIRKYRPEQVEVDYPVTEPVPVQEERNQEPSEWNPSPKKINFWTGDHQ